MKITYHFDGAVPVLYGPGTHINNGWYEPHYHIEEMEDVEFEYEVEPDDSDYIEYLMPDFYGEQWKNLEKKDRDLMLKGAKVAIANIISDFDSLKEELEEDDNFEEFIRDRYEEEARKAFDEECEDY